MASGVNKVWLLGYVGHDPVIRYTPDGQPFTKINLCVNESWTDKKTGERKEKAGWHRLVLHKKKAELAQKFIQKGSKLLIEGHLHTRSYLDPKDKIERFITEIIVIQLCFLGSSLASKHPIVIEPANDAVFDEPTSFSEEYFACDEDEADPC